MDLYNNMQFSSDYVAIMLLNTSRTYITKTLMGNATYIQVKPADARVVPHHMRSFPLFAGKVERRTLHNQDVYIPPFVYLTASALWVASPEFYYIYDEDSILVRENETVMRDVYSMFSVYTLLNINDGINLPVDTILDYVKKLTRRVASFSRQLAEDFITEGPGKADGCVNSVIYNDAYNEVQKDGVMSFSQTSSDGSYGVETVVYIDDILFEHFGPKCNMVDTSIRQITSHDTFLDAIIRTKTDIKRRTGKGYENIELEIKFDSFIYVK